VADRQVASPSSQNPERKKTTDGGDVVDAGSVCSPPPQTLKTGKTSVGLRTRKISGTFNLRCTRNGQTTRNRGERQTKIRLAWCIRRVAQIRLGREIDISRSIRKPFMREDPPPIHGCTGGSSRDALLRHVTGQVPIKKAWACGSRHSGSTSPLQSGHLASGLCLT